MVTYPVTQLVSAWIQTWFKLRPSQCRASTATHHASCRLIHWHRTTVPTGPSASSIYCSVMLVWKPSLTGIHRFHLQHPASTAATLYCMKHSPWLLSCRSPFEITSLIEILPMPVLPSSRCSDSKGVLRRYIKKKVPFLIWHVPERVATQLVFKIISNYACFNKSLLFVILSDIVCSLK